MNPLVCVLFVLRSLVYFSEMRWGASGRGVKWLISVQIHTASCLEGYSLLFSQSHLQMQTIVKPIIKSFNYSVTHCPVWIRCRWLKRTDAVAMTELFNWPEHTFSLCTTFESLTNIPLIKICLLFHTLRDVTNITPTHCTSPDHPQSCAAYRTYSLKPKWKKYCHVQLTTYCYVFNVGRWQLDDVGHLL